MRNIHHNVKSVVILFGLLISFYVNPLSASTANVISWNHYLSTNEILDYTAHDGTLWVGTTGGLAEYEIATGNMQVHSLAEWGESNDVYRVEVGPDGIVWAMTNQTVSRYDGIQWEVYKGTYYDTQFKDVQFDSNGTLWGIDETAYYFYDTEGYHRQNLIPGEPLTTFTKLIIDDNDTVWLCKPGFNYKGYLLAPLIMYRIENSQVTEYEFECESSYVSEIITLPNDHRLMSIKYILASAGPYSPKYYAVYELAGASYDSLTATTPLVAQFNYSDLHLGHDGSIWKMENNLVAEYRDGEWVAAPDDYISTHVFGRVDMGPDNAVWCISERGIAGEKNDKWTLYETIGDEHAVPISLLGFTDDGALWCCTDQGVAKFNGTSWETYATADSIAGPVVTECGLLYRSDSATIALCDNGTNSNFTDATKLDSNSVFNLQTGTYGRLWAMTPNGLSYYENGIWNKRLTMNLQKRDALFTFDNSGTLWFVGSDPLEYSLYSLTGGGIPQQVNVSFDRITALEASPQGDLFIGTNSGGIKLQGNSTSLFLSGTSITDIECLNDGSVWFGTVENGMYQFEKGEWIHHESEVLINNQIHAVESHPSHGIIIATQDGLCRYQNKLWTSYHPDFDISPTLPPLASPSISDIFIDATSRLWAAKTVLSIADGSGWRTVLTPDDGLTSDITAMAELPDGTVWCGTESSGLFSCSLEQINSVVEPHTEIIWPMHIIPLPSLSKPGIFVIDRNDLLYLANEFSFDGAMWSWLYLPDFVVRDMDYDGASIWYSSNTGIYRLRDGTLDHYTTEHGLLEDPVRVSAITEHGDLWSSHSHADVGLSRYRDEEWQGFTPDDGIPEGVITGLYPLYGDTLLIKSDAGVLAKYDGTSWSPYTLSINAPGELVADIEPDGDGGMWISTQGWGLYHLVSGNDEVNRYDTASGLPSDSLSTMHRHNDGNLWVQTPTGLVLITDDTFSNYSIGPVGWYDIDSENRAWACILGRLIQIIPSLGGIALHPLIPVAVEQDKETTAPAIFGKLSNYPNPFNPSTTITFALANPGVVTLDVYNLTGQLVATLVDGFFKAGEHSEVFDGSGMSSGLYFYRLETVDGIRTGKMVLMK